MPIYFTAGAQAAPAAPKVSQPPASNSVRDEVRQAIQDATGAVREVDGSDPGVRSARGDGGTVTIDRRPEGITITRTGSPEIAVQGAGVGGFQAGVIPTEAVEMAMGFFIMCVFIVIGWPIARAFGRRIERRDNVPVMSATATEQLQRIEQAVDAISIEVERISETQRFLAKLPSSGGHERLPIPSK